MSKNKEYNVEYRNIEGKTSILKTIASSHEEAKSNANTVIGPNTVVLSTQERVKRK